MLHLHMLVQLLGFAHPDDIFKRGILDEMIRRVWTFVSSICFRSSEAFARYLKDDSASAALQCAPLMPLSEKQRCMIGPQRTQESFHAQLKARGLKEPCPADKIVRWKHTSWPPAAYRSRSWHKLRRRGIPSCSDFSAVAIQDVHSASLSFGNHVCKPRVCHKGRIGRMGFCRMMFWHWAKVPRKTSGKRKRDIDGSDVDHCAKRQHGLALQSQWLEGQPPVHVTPPQIGIPGLEVTQPFHYRMTPGIAMGPRCNHDLGILLRVPALKPKDAVVCGAQPNEAVIAEELRDSEMSIDAMVEALIDHEYYCVSYSTKEEPHIEGLLHTFADGVRNIDLEIAQRRSLGQEVESLEHARKLLHRLLHSTNRRMHKGYPEMISYILQKPDHYASHSFVPFYCDSDCCQLIDAFQSHFQNAESFRGRPRTFFPGRAPLLQLADYEYRPQELESYPQYFFVAACSVHLKWKPEQTLCWYEDGDICHPIKTAVQSYVYDPRWPQEPLPRGEFDSAPLLQYPYYVELRREEPWRVPVLHCKFPERPLIADGDLTDEAKIILGRYALTMMFLFRPFRNFYGEIVVPSREYITGQPTCANRWRALYDEFNRWRLKEIESVASVYFTGPGIDKKTT